MSVLVTWDEYTSGQPPRGGTIEELVLAEVVNLTSRRRPLMSSIGTQSVSSTYVEQLTDTLASRGVNAFVEGVAFTQQASTQPSRHFSHVQHFAKFGIISDEQRLVSHYNEDPFTYQVRKKLNELMNDIEHALMRGTAVTGATDAARQLDGLLNVTSSTTSTTFLGDTASAITLTEEVMIDLLQVFRDNAFDVLPSQLYCASLLKRTISEFSTRITRNVDAAARRQELIIERHTSDFGDVDVIYSEDQIKGTDKEDPQNSMSFIDPQYFQVGWLQPPTVENLPRDGFRDRFQMQGQATLLYRNSSGGGFAKNLVSYIGQT